LSVVVYSLIVVTVSVLACDVWDDINIYMF